MILAAKSNSLEMNPSPMGKMAWIGLLFFSFLICWPIGLAILAYLLWSGKMKCCHSDRADHSHDHGFRMFFHTLSKGCCSHRHAASTGNSAFDEYRKETLRRLEEDQREFIEFLDRLRRARDRAEFDQFMGGRNRRSDANDDTAAN